MDIGPIYELRTRLRAAAIAGTGLLPEDFRLKRAAEAIQPLEAVSPVFARIGSLTRSLFSPDQPDKEGVLLDTLTLLDALLCTQGETAVSGELRELPVQNRGNAVSNAPYSDIKAILDALTNSGGGRYAYLTEMRNSRPELFEDYRVKPALVQALGASYAELAEDVQKWLLETDESVLPLLQKGFDPRGRKEMLRRVEVIDALAGAKANDFYREQLPEAEKDVRQALIYALRHSPENEELLLSLVKTEKGKLKKTAYFALACQEGGEAKACIEKLMEKNPEDAIAALSVSGTAWASEMVRAGIFEAAERLEAGIEQSGGQPEQDREVKDSAVVLCNYLEALKGKNAETICECVRRLIRLADRPEMTDLKLISNLTYGNYNKDTFFTLRTFLGVLLTDCLAVRPDAELLPLIEELYGKYKKTGRHSDFFTGLILAKLLLEGDCTEWLREELGSEETSPLPLHLVEALDGAYWSEQRKNWMIEKWAYCPPLGRYITYKQELRQRVEGDFIRILIEEADGRLKDRQGKIMFILEKCIPKGDVAYETLVTDYFYRQALQTTGDRVLYYCRLLKKHNYPKCRGLGMQYLEGPGKFYMWQVINLFQCMPGTIEERRAEAQEVLQGIRSGRLFNVHCAGEAGEMEQLETFFETLS